VIPFDGKEPPRLEHNTLSLCRKSYQQYHSSQLSYRELINAENSDLFGTWKLSLFDDVINFGIKAPPLLPFAK
jgi:hypothetical protein